MKNDYIRYRYSNNLSQRAWKNKQVYVKNFKANNDIKYLM